MFLCKLLLAASLTLGGICHNQSYAVLDNKTICLELAQTPQERSRGLMFRKSLCDNCGMLFIFDTEERRPFWMLNTYLPLDIVFIDRRQVVVDIKRASPCPGMPCPDYLSSSKAKYVLEVKQETFSDAVVGKKITLALQ